MVEPGRLREARYADRFLRDLARRLNFLAESGRCCVSADRFLADVKRMLEAYEADRAGAPVR